MATLVDLAAPLSIESARQHVHDEALTDSAVGPAGLEIETHLVDLADASRHVEWSRVQSAVAALGVLPAHSAVTVEPGGQIELSGPPMPSVAAAINAMRHDSQRARLILADLGLGLAHLGTDPLRAPRRINPRPRYHAMEQHFVATARGDAGRQMMASSAALQVNLQAGPADRWADRFALAQQLGPVLIAASACSPWLSGSDTGWKSARQRAWAGLDPYTSGPLPAGDVPTQWAERAMRAPVMFTVGADGAIRPVGRTVAFGDWVAGRIRLADRRPTFADLGHHLTTLFPPVRPRGYLEIRYLDVTAPRWWPAVAALTTTLLDDPLAADLAAEATRPTSGLWTEAARDGLTDPRIGRAARRCLAIAADRAPAKLSTAVADLAELVHSGRSPGDLLVERIAEVGPVAAYAEAAHA